MILSIIVTVAIPSNRVNASYENGGWRSCDIWESQSPLIGSMLPTYDGARRMALIVVVAIPSNRVNASYRSQTMIKTISTQSQSPLIGSMLPTLRVGPHVSGIEVAIPSNRVNASYRM